MNNLDFTNLKENTTHGDFILPFSIYKGTLSPSFPSIAAHWHEEIEVIIVLDGSCDYRINLDSFVINKGDILIIDSQSLHSLTYIPSKNMTWASFVFNINMLKSSNTDGALLKYIAPLLNHEHQLPIILKDNIDCYSKIFDVIEDIIYCYYEKDIAYELELKSLLFKFFSLLYKNDLIKKHQSKNNLTINTTDKIKLVLNYINDHYSEDISINTLAELCEYSEYHFMRFFKKHIGLTCVQYINNLRLEKSSILLTSTNNAIMDVSLEVGFDNLSYFNKLFKRKYNLTPKEFRTINSTIFK
ncbi:MULTISPECIES: AraC family transcriptional regulator [unclassified Clostridium]|uniref:AraC family transcriptional regulator n=1 Tax=unclassified Clostridium TaxID=2614128 RepID=UPI00189B3C68|nr:MULTISPECIES: AraC family transcriptional regulator [unclassified Clostridium]MBP3916286.1 helix-turn-helix transcriptional regulator [Clostridium sp.]MBQ9012610.1 helix-turn-helix transcriptional regulator [Bacilli bacterium]MEE0932296.1 AraC family transcriptional regulator [Clostridium sp.]